MDGNKIHALTSAGPEMIVACHRDVLIRVYIIVLSHRRESLILMSRSGSNNTIFIIFINLTILIHAIKLDADVDHAHNVVSQIVRTYVINWFRLLTGKLSLSLIQNEIVFAAAATSRYNLYESSRRPKCSPITYVVRSVSSCNTLIHIDGTRFEQFLLK
jgi:hypothetical protein